jgi:hypothetical protein
LGGHWVVEVQAPRHWPSTQSFPIGHWSALVQASAGRGRHSPVTHISVEAQSVSAAQRSMQVLLTQA